MVHSAQEKEQDVFQPQRALPRLRFIVQKAQSGESDQISFLATPEMEPKGSAQGQRTDP